MVGFCAVDVEGVAPGNTHCQLVGEFVLRSVKFTQPGWHITCGVPLKLATGGVQVCTVTVMVLELADAGDAQARSDVIVHVIVEPVASELDVNVAELVPALEPFTAH